MDNKEIRGIAAGDLDFDENHKYERKMSRSMSRKLENHPEYGDIETDIKKINSDSSH